MHYQYDRKYAQIGTNGCAFISCGVWAEEIAGKKLSDRDVSEAYADLVSERSMGWNCYIRDWADVVNTFLSFLGSEKSVAYIGWWNEDSEVYFEPGFDSKDVDFEILRVSTSVGYHFKTPGFNPYPELSQGDEINGRRYFKVL